MFGTKSAGIADEMVNALSIAGHAKDRAPVSTPVLAPVSPGIRAKDETYIAPTQFTVVSMPFYRWSQ